MPRSARGSALLGGELRVRDGGVEDVVPDEGLEGNAREWVG